PFSLTEQSLRSIDSQPSLGQISSRLIRPAGCIPGGNGERIEALSAFPLPERPGQQRNHLTRLVRSLQRMRSMRDFRDAKTMAQTLREALTARAVSISHSESLELVSRMLGIADWNTLSAMLQADRRPGASPGASPAADPPVARDRIEAARYPAVPIRDFVPFPAAVFPLF